MQETSADDSSYAALGDRVTGILEAAEQAAAEIREEARTLAADLEREARAAAVQVVLPAEESLARDLQTQAPR
jgi:hypothetical protein